MTEVIRFFDFHSAGQFLKAPHMVDSDQDLTEVTGRELDQNVSTLSQHKAQDRSDPG